VCTGLLMASLVGCRHEPVVQGPWATGTDKPGLVFAEASLDDRAVIDQLYETWIQLEGRKGAARLLLDAATSFQSDTLRTSKGARDVVVYGIYQVVQAGMLSAQFSEIRSVVDRLVRVAPNSPQARFSLAYLRWILLADATGTLAQRGMSNAVVLDLYRNLDLLVRHHPNFDGPATFDRKRIHRERDAVSELVAQLPRKVTQTGGSGSQ